MSETVELKPCPFCGSDGKMIRPMGVRVFNRDATGRAIAPFYGPDWFRVTCSNTDCHCSTRAYADAADAATAWNTRSDPAVRDRVTDEMLSRVKDALANTGSGTHHSERLIRTILNAALRTSPPEPASGLEAEFTFTLQPMDSAPAGDDVLEPSEIDVHDGAWAVVLGTNAKPIGWIDTHALFDGRTYRNRLLALTSNQEGNDEA